MKYFTIVCMLFLISCESTSSRTDKFADLRNVDFAQGKPYSVAADRNNSVYYVEYDTLSYIVRMPIDSDSIISVYQKKTYVQNKKQKLRSYHTAPGLEYGFGSFGSTHRIG